MNAGVPEISVVVASNNAVSSVEACLDALVPVGGQAELLVVDNSTDGTTEIIRDRFPGLRLIRRPAADLIPQLWGVGMRESRGKIVAITTAHCVPGPGWVRRMLQAQSGSAPAIGGAIENDPSGTLIDWAVYFCRYSAYMPPLPEGPVPEIPGDNASYRREDLDRHADSWRDGFWEPVFHAELKRSGQELLLVPSIVVTHKRSFRFGAFMRGRYRHGTQFGAWRASQLPASRKVLHVALYPLIPFVLLLRIIRQVLGKRRHRARLLVSLPFIFAFLLSWATGELVGALGGGKG